MSILPVVKKIEPEQPRIINDEIDDETDEQSEEEEIEQIITVKPRKKVVKKDLFDCPEPEPEEEEEEEEVNDETEEVNQNFIYEEPEPVKLVKPKKKKPARCYDEGYREGDNRVMLDKNGNKRWINDKVVEKARERMIKFHEDGRTYKLGKGKKKKETELKVQQVQPTNQINEEMMIKYQEDLKSLVQKASFEAVEAYDTKRKERKALKRSEEQAKQVSKELHNKLLTVGKAPIPYGEKGYWNQCWETQ